MKKIMIGLLALGMIAGCAQQPIEPPIEPPVVEEPEEQPEEPIEEVIDEVSDVVEIREHKFDVPEYQISNKNDLLTEFLLQIPLLKDESEEAQIFNERMMNEFETFISQSVYESGNEGEFLRETTLQRVKAYLNKDIVSIVIQRIPYRYQTGYVDYCYVYNFDMKLKKMITNEEFFQHFKLNRLEIEEKLSSYLTDNFVTYEDEEHIESNKINGYDKSQTNRIYLSLVEPVQVYMKEDNIHVVVSGSKAIWATYFDIEIN